METLMQLWTGDSAAHTVLVLGLIIALGLALGSVRFFGIQLGAAGVLFAGLFFGHFKVSIHPEIAEFTREFGLILFVYTLGMQVGPGFFSSFRRQGVVLNLLAAFVVLSGAGLTVLLGIFGKIPFPLAAGLFSGATTNTPSLAAAQQALKEIPGIFPDFLKMPGMGYALSYPFGILGIILVMILVRILFRIKPVEESRAYAAAHAAQNPVLEILDLRVENKNLSGKLIHEIPGLKDSGIVISRILHGTTLEVALPDSCVQEGDIIRAVGSREKLEAFQLIVGSRAMLDLRGTRDRLSVRQILVTRKKMARRRVGDLEAFLFGVTITRIRRGELEFPAAPEIEINFADSLTVVGEEEAIRKFSGELGNSEKELNHPELIPVFIGIVLGVILGSVPFHFGGMPAPVKLGLAGGPLIVSILLSRAGRIGNLVWYMPAGANFMLRETGITLFLACVGLRSGDHFVETLATGQGVYWMCAGALITVIPLFLVALYARIFLRMNYLTLCGLLAGSMTDPPALAFANQISPSSAQVISYASVYPAVMILRVVCAQVMVLFFMR